MQPADPQFLGASVTAQGVNFAIWSDSAEAVEICLFDEVDGKFIESRFTLAHRSGPIWHGYLAGVRVGQRYGYRIYGPWKPEIGLRFNPAKLLLDPYTHQLAGHLQYSPEIYGHVSADELGSGDTTIQDGRDSAAKVPYSVVTAFNPRNINRLKTPWAKTLIYEAHLVGLTQNNPEITESERGSYRALGHPSTIAYLQKIGVTALELLPIAQSITEPAIWDRGRINHWGYNPIAFSTPQQSYASSNDPISELQWAVDQLHNAGIEIILDVVFNHTGEGGVGGPTLSFRGIDNKAWYRHQSGGEYIDVTGCGNTVNASEPPITRHIIDSLRWWSEVIGVDGFRFDLATALYRDNSAADSSLLAAISVDPILRDLKLIAEPWDVTRYSLGDFGYPWREWNDHYRDSLRQFWLGDLARGYGKGVGDLASRISGSSDIFYYRGPTSSINFITAHDGFTLNDLVTYQSKVNQPNGEDNRDGGNSDRSWNLGLEGPTPADGSQEEIAKTRRSLKKSMLATLLLSSGVPMLLMGDEVSRSQRGSNNAYSLPLDPKERAGAGNSAFGGGWALAWELNEEESEMLESVSELARIRSTYLADISSEFFTGTLDLGTQRKDIAWMNLAGEEMNSSTWQDGEQRNITIYIEASSNRALLLLLNSSQSAMEFTLPGPAWGERFRSIFDASSSVATYEPKISGPGGKVQVAPHSCQLWLVTRA